VSARSSFGARIGVAVFEVGRQAGAQMQSRVRDRPRVRRRKLPRRAACLSSRQCVPSRFLEEGRPRIDLRGHGRNAAKDQHGRREPGKMATRHPSKLYWDWPTSQACMEIEEGGHRRDQGGKPPPGRTDTRQRACRDLGFDSLQVLDVIAELEGRFDISIPLDEVPATRTVAQVVAQVTRLLDARGAAE
jgi:acyl carrier protein